MSRSASRFLIAVMAGATAVLASAVTAGGVAPALAATARKPPAIAYIVGFESRSVARITTTTNRARSPIRLGLRAFSLSVVITPNGKTVYVAGYATGTVTPISTRTGKPGKAIKVPRQPVDLAVTPNGKTVYVASEITGDNESPGRVTPISTATNTAGRPLRVGINPGPMVITANSTTVYVATSGFSSQTGSGNVTVIRGHKITKLIRLADYPDALMLSPDDATLWVANDPDTAPDCYPSPTQPGPAKPWAHRRTAVRTAAAMCGQLVPIPTATNHPGTAIPTDDSDMALMARRGGEVYVLSEDGALQAVNTAARKISWTAKLNRFTSNLVMTPGGHSLYAVSAPSGTHPGYITPISPVTGRLGRRIPVGPDPYTMGFTRNGRTGYVLCSPEWVVGDTLKLGTGTVVPISTSTNKPARPIKVGRGPVAIAISR